MRGALRHTRTVDGGRPGLLSLRRAVSDASPLATTEPTRPNVSAERVSETSRVARGACVGRFVLLEEVGSGGGGEVWRAFDPELDRTIAIKLLHGTPRGIVGEAQALAQVNHPNVARIHDVGTVQLGRLYTFLAVEFVEGPTLAEHCRRLRDTGGQARQIVRTFVRLGLGLAAVHDEGLVHRDVKPANALLNPQGEPVLVDFGLAQSQEDTESSTGIAGTLGYMAPEQHQGMAVTAASDVYSLCVSLWEALCGALPFGGGTRAEFLAAKLSGLEDHVAPRSIPRRVARVLVRGLHPDASKRFADTRSLLRELERANTRRRWPALLAGGVAVGSAVAFVAAQSSSDPCEVGMGESWSDAHRTSVTNAMLAVDVPYGRNVTRSTVAELDRWADSWVSSRGAVCRAADIRGETNRDTSALQAECYARMRSRFDAIVEGLSRSDVAAVDIANEMVTGLHDPGLCEDGAGLRAAGGFEPPSVADASAVRRVRYWIDSAEVQRVMGNLDEAEGLLAHAGAAPGSNPNRRASLEVAAGSVALAREDHERAEVKFRSGLALALAAGDWALVHRTTVALINLVGSHLGRTDEALRYREFAEGLVEGGWQPRFDTLVALGGVHRRAGDVNDAQQAYEDALELVERERGARSLESATVYSELGALLAKSKPRRSVELAQRAYEIRERMLGAGHPDVIRAQVRLAWSLAGAGRLPKQLATLEQAERSVPKGTPQEAEVAHALGGALSHVGRCDEAEPHVLRAVELWGGAGGELDLRGATYRFHLASLRECQGRFEEAQAQAERVVKARTRILGPAHIEVAEAMGLVARNALNRGDMAGGITLLRRALDVMIQAVGEEHLDVAAAKAQLGSVLRAVGESKEAEGYLRAALATYAEATGLDQPNALFASVNLADTLLGLGKVDEAAELARFSWKHMSSNPVTPPAERGYVSFVLALALWEAEDESSRREALNYANVAISNFEQAEAFERVAETRAWLESRR